MKSFRARAALPAGCLAALALFSSGCLALRDRVLRPRLATNMMVLPAVTNNVLATNAVVTAQVITNVVTHQTETLCATNWAVSTNITVLPSQVRMLIVTNAWEPAPAALDAAQGLGAAVNVAAPGAGTAVAWGLSGLLSLFAAYQTRKAGNHQGAVEALGKAIEQTRVALQASGPAGKAIAAGITDVIEGHAESAGPAVASIIEETASRAGGDTTSAVALHAASAALHRAATAEELMTAAQSGLLPDWFSAAERAAVARIKA